jgi:Uma2 family endonuclease
MTMSSRPPIDTTPFPTTVRQRRLTVDEYHRMIQARIVHEDEPLELVDGLLVSMTPQGVPHARVIQRLNRALIDALGPEYAVRPQLPLTLGVSSEPEPDLAVVEREEAEAIDHHPRTALLVIEVGGDSLRYDRTVKAALYAGAAIPEYWIVDVEKRCVEVHREPEAPARRYRTVLTLGSGDTATCESVPRLSVALQALFA